MGLRLAAEAAPHEVGQQPQEASALDGDGQLALVLGRDPGLAARFHAPAVADEATQQLGVLVVDGLAGLIEVIAATPEAAPAATTTTTTTATTTTTTTASTARGPSPLGPLRG